MVKFPKQRRNYRAVKRLRMISIETSQRLVQLLPKLCQVQTLSLDPRKLRANWQHPGDECYPPPLSLSPSPSLIRLCLQWGFEDNNREAHKLHWTARVLAALFSMRLCLHQPRISHVTRVHFVYRSPYKSSIVLLVSI